ncbi:zinc-dependent alcohol dehydrogenase [Methylobrevis pamukkalensis]|uniref:2-deoxy-scyllo-inosamine dehydrogenase n=1 Tax=Methylobrevis pamukkalensis TaxID=1439726 RepID=A0A1E3H3R0_9HYPH|nr:zinc-binding alcohol dehydrogenase [Methylobrevis pamukkalensis]ODN70987.1 2-deoxy-scyllo-inosamine dehydrogenase [Methylobrevis pamukkalensis]
MRSGPDDATALWIEAAGQAALRAEPLRAPGPGEVLVETVFSGISRGTESLVFAGRVPDSEHARMRCPGQDGDFPFPVKYGYAAVGRIAAGDEDLLGREVFCLHPHQDRFLAAADSVTPLPEGLPAHRAALGANMETALNILWDAGVLPGDRVAVIGAGTVGLLSAWIAARIPGTEVTLVDVDPARAGIAIAFGCGFADPASAPDDCDVVIHASGHGAGLATAIGCCGFEARLVEASWYGEREIALSLGGAFHSRRIEIVSSQVGAVSPCRRARRSHRDRLTAALGLLADPLLDMLLTGETDFADLPGAYGRILSDPRTLCHRVRYI